MSNPEKQSELDARLARLMDHTARAERAECVATLLRAIPSPIGSSPIELHDAMLIMKLADIIRKGSRDE